MPSHYLRMLAPLLLVLQLGCACATTNEASQCQGDLDELARFLPVNDSGASAEMAGHGKAIDEAYQKARAESAQAADPARCELVLGAYLRAWRPGHLWLVADAPATAAGAGPEAGQDARDKPPADPRAPSFRVLDQRTVLLTFRTFDDHFKPAVEALLASHRAALESHANWIIDVRDNNGGSDATFTPLLPWLMDMESLTHSVEWLATPANARAQADVCALSGDGAACATILAPVVQAIKAGTPGSYVMRAGARVDFALPANPEAHQPARVAVLVDRACWSSCEQFLLLVRESFKVKLLGRPSQGSLDYSNLRPYRLPSGKRTLMYATSRSTRLPAMPIDQIGVQPDILLLPAPVDDAARDVEVGQAQRWLAGGTLSPH